MNAISQTIFSKAYSGMTMYCFRLNFTEVFIPDGPIGNIPALVQIMALRHTGDKPLSVPMLPRLLRRLYAALGVDALRLLISLTTRRFFLPYNKSTIKDLQYLPNVWGNPLLLSVGFPAQMPVKCQAHPKVINPSAVWSAQWLNG